MTPNVAAQPRAPLARRLDAHVRPEIKLILAPFILSFYSMSISKAEVSPFCGGLRRRVGKVFNGFAM
jgi:hypothetical protein